MNESEKKRTHVKMNVLQFKRIPCDNSWFSFIHYMNMQHTRTAVAFTSSDRFNRSLVYCKIFPILNLGNDLLLMKRPRARRQNVDFNVKQTQTHRQNMKSQIKAKFSKTLEMRLMKFLLAQPFSMWFVHDAKIKCKHKYGTHYMWREWKTDSLQMSRNNFIV